MGYGSSYSIVNKQIVSQEVKTEIVPIAVSSLEKCRPLNSVHFYVYKKLKLFEQILDLQKKGVTQI